MFLFSPCLTFFRDSSMVVKEGLYRLALALALANAPPRVGFTSGTYSCRTNLTCKTPSRLSWCSLVARRYCFIGRFPSSMLVPKYASSMPKV